MAPQAAVQGPLWTDLVAELFPEISRPLTWEAEGLLVEVLRFEGRLRLTISSDLPHSMSPEDMLKSLAAQALGRWTGLAYLQEMERVQVTTQSSSLSSLVRDVIYKAREESKPRETKQEVAVINPTDAMKIVRPLVQERGMWHLGGVRVRVGPQERQLANC
jgi:hypothetical protein